MKGSKKKKKNTKIFLFQSLFSIFSLQSVQKLQSNSGGVAFFVLCLSDKQIKNCDCLSFFGI